MYLEACMQHSKLSGGKGQFIWCVYVYVCVCGQQADCAVN